MSTQLAFANAEPAPGGRFRLPPADPAVQYADAAPVFAVVVRRLPACDGGAVRGLLSSLHRPGEQFPAAARQPRRLCRVAERRDARPLHGRPRRAKGRHRRRRQDRRGLWPAAAAKHADRRGRARRRIRRTRPTSPWATSSTAPTRPKFPLTVRDPNGRVRDVTVITGEEHIEAGARALGVSAKMLSFIDLLPVLAYPFLLWAAWLLHRRNSRDVGQLDPVDRGPVHHRRRAALVGVPRVRGRSRAGSTSPSTISATSCSSAGILLFPHGNLSWRMRRPARLVADPLLPSRPGCTRASSSAS